MTRGIVQSWVREHGYGWILSFRDGTVQYDGGRYFCHVATIVTDAPETERNLAIGQVVVFEPGVTRKGPIATSVRALRPGELGPADVPTLDPPKAMPADARKAKRS